MSLKDVPPPPLDKNRIKVKGRKPTPFAKVSVKRAKEEAKDKAEAAKKAIFEDNLARAEVQLLEKGGVIADDAVIKELSSKVKFEDKDVIFKPNPGPQTQFLAASEREVFYGGARGGGKSYAMLIDPLRYCNFAAFRAVIIRKTMPELRDLIFKALQLYPKAYPGTRFKQQESTFYFPSGARIEFGFAESMKDVLRYQGQSYCVAENTKILMGDLSYKNIQDINVGELVQTLEGPKKVTYTHEVGVKECVRLDVFSKAGHKIASQLQPANHSVLANEIKPYESLLDSYHNFEHIPQSLSQWQSYKHFLYACPEMQGISVYLINEKTYYVASEQKHVIDSLLDKSYFPVMLHGLDRQLNQFQSDVSTQCRTSYKYGLQLWQTFQKILKTQIYPEKPFAQILQSQDHKFLLSLLDDVSYVRTDLQIIEDSLYRYLSFGGFYGEQLHQEVTNVLNSAPSQACVEVLNRVCLHLDEMDYTPLDSLNEYSSYIHPYTKEQRNVEVPVKLGIGHIYPSIFSPVYDLTIEDANHYISFGGIVNQNSWIGVDELPQYDSPEVLDMLRSSLRSTDPNVPIMLRCTGNPGNVGSVWVRDQFIDPAPPGIPFNIEVLIKTPIGEQTETITRRFIPAKVWDNPYLTYDLSYAAMLANLPEVKRKQFLEGDWDVFEGAAFPEFNKEIHVKKGYPIPSSWPRFRGADWGYSSPGCVLWIAVTPDKELVVYREMYFKEMHAPEVADAVLEREQGENVAYGILDISAWSRRGELGPSIGQTMNECGCRWKPSGRVAVQGARNSRISGKLELHRRLALNPRTKRPWLTIFDNCVNLIRTLPRLPVDSNDTEDVDTDAEDHAYDALRYALMSRPITIGGLLVDRNNPTKSSRWKPVDSTFGY